MALLNVKITNDDGSFAVLDVPFDYQPPPLPPPQPQSINPTSGAPGATVVIAGANFRSAVVDFGAKRAAIVSQSETQIICVVPVQ